MRNSRKVSYSIFFIVVSVSIIILHVSNFVSLSSRNVTARNEETWKKEVSSGRILAQGVQGVMDTRDDLIRFRRRSVYSHIDRLVDCLFRGFLDTLMWLTEEYYKSEESESYNDLLMIEKIIRKQVSIEGITLSNRTVNNEVKRIKERHDEIIDQGTTSDVFKRMMKLYEIENNLTKDVIKKISAPNREEDLIDILNVHKIKNKIMNKLTKVQYTFDDALIEAVAARVIGRVTDISRDEDII
ncbi:gametocyte associated protein, putative [Plasmodium ovale]|uniref:Gametocyte associated protein, putative n=2 Tax=Plasmodium ovale TaxID=36330 RepID=A0A1D3U952_PLAOA|nr:gametocyte associated protein, putative [Plasmodium ovale]